MHKDWNRANKLYEREQFAEAFGLYLEIYQAARIANDVEQLGQVACRLGECYLSGEGTNEDHQRAVMYFKEACACGDVDGKAYYGIMLLGDFGRFCADPEQGAKYLHQAARDGSIQAVYGLAGFYESGDYAPYIPQDFDMAVQYYKQAKRLGVPYAQADIDRFSKPLFAKHYKRLRAPD